MFLYTINGVYPDKNFNWVINPLKFNCADKQHTHEVSEITDLQNRLDTKANSDHNHSEYFKKITVNGVIITNGANLLTSSSTLTINKIPDVAELELELNNTVPTPIVGFRNVNDKRYHTVIKIANGDIIIEDDFQSIVFIEETKRY